MQDKKNQVKVVNNSTTEMPYVFTIQRQMNRYGCVLSETSITVQDHSFKEAKKEHAKLRKELK